MSAGRSRIKILKFQKHPIKKLQMSILTNGFDFGTPLSVLRIREAHTGSGSATKNLSIYNPKTCFYAVGKIFWDVHPGSGFVPHPGSVSRIQGSKTPGSATLPSTSLLWHESVFRYSSFAWHATNTLRRCCAGTEVGGRSGAAHRPAQAVLHAARPGHALRGSQHARPHPHVRSTAQEVRYSSIFSFLVVKLFIYLLKLKLCYFGAVLLKVGSKSMLQLESLLKQLIFFYWRLLTWIEEGKNRLCKVPSGACKIMEFSSDPVIKRNVQFWSSDKEECSVLIQWKRVMFLPIADFKG